MAPPWQDIDVLESVRKALNALSGEAYTSVSYLKPVLQLFNEELLKPEADETELTKTIKATVISYLNEKYADDATDDLLNIASLADPRFKTRYIKENKVEAVKYVAEMLDECRSISHSHNKSDLSEI